VILCFSNVIFGRLLVSLVTGITHTPSENYEVMANSLSISTNYIAAFSASHKKGVLLLVSLVPLCLNDIFFLHRCLKLRGMSSFVFQHASFTGKVSHQQNLLC